MRAKEAWREFEIQIFKEGMVTSYRHEYDTAEVLRRGE